MRHTPIWRFRLQGIGQFVRQQTTHRIGMASIDQRVDLLGGHHATCGVMHQHPIGVTSTGMQQRAQPSAHAIRPCRAAGSDSSKQGVRMGLEHLIHVRIVRRQHQYAMRQACHRAECVQGVHHHWQAGNGLVLFGQRGPRAAAKARTGNHNVKTISRRGGG